MANVGYATLQIIPSVRGIADELRRQLVAPAQNIGERAGDAAAGGFRDAFTSAVAAIGVTEIASALGGKFSDAFSEALEQGSVGKTLSAQLGSSGAVAGRQGAAVGRLFSQAVTENFEQGAEVVRQIAGGGLVPTGATVRQLDVLGTKFADVANTFGTDMTLQTQAVSALLKNRLAPDAGAALDVITAGFQRLGPQGEDLLETFQEYPVQLRKLGLDAKTSLGLFQQGLQGGARDTDIIADAFKEFSIRAIDMSQSSQDAYKLLGLSATDMSAQIAKGGKSASNGLQTVLDRLRATEDPVKQNAAAVGLFGTQAEDMGAALFALDPSRASAAFGDVTGAADRLGRTLRSGPSYEIKLFTRTVKQGLVDFIGGQVLPILSDWGVVITGGVLPPLAAVGSVVGAVLVPVLLGLGTAVSGTVGWLREWGVWLVPLAVLIGGVTLALNAQAIATGIMTAVFSAYRTAILIGTAVTNGFAAAQTVLNGVLALNPITLIVIGLVALGAAFYVAWQRSSAFRGGVMAAWEGVKTGWSALWNSVLKPGFDLMMAGLRAIGSVVIWLWSTVLSPVFGFIGTAAKVLLTAVVVVVLLPIIAAVKLVGAVFGWLWDVAIGPVIGWLITGFKLWWAVAKIQFGYFTAGVRALGAVAVWLWQKAISPVIGWIIMGAKLLWTSAKIQLGYLRTGLRALGDAGIWLYRSAIKPSFDSIAAAGRWLYDKGIKPPLDKGKAAAKAFGAAFTAAKDVIGTQFGKVADLAKKPISFVVGVVYNKGLVPVWNRVASAFGAPKLSEMKGFAVGGPVRGPGTETSDSVLARLSRNEHVWTAKEVRGAGGHGAMLAMRRSARAGQLALPGFKDGGGLFGWIGSAGSALSGWGSKAWDTAKKGAGWLKDTLAGSARAGVNAVVRPLLERIPGLGSGFGDVIAKIPGKMIDALFGYADKADAKGASAIQAGPGALGKWIAQAMKLTGVPASWAGPLRTLIMRESGGNPKAINLWDSNAKAGHPSQGLMQTIPSTFAAYRLTSLPNDITHPIANIVAGIRYILSRYGSIFNVQQAVGSTPKGYASGGSPRPGEIAWVGENGPELMQFRGGEVIYSNADSMRMAAGLGGLRGFARGTSSAARKAARGQIPGDLTGFTKALTGSASGIAKAAAELAKDLRAAGGAGKGLATQTGKVSAKLQGLAARRSAVDSLLATAKQASADQQKTAADFLGLGSLGDVTSVNDLIVGLRGKQRTAAGNETAISTLSKKGLSQDLISQLVAMGPDSGLARIVAGASGGQIKQLNAIAKNSAKLAVSYGRTMADSMFDAGKDAGRGFLVGLQSQQKALQAEMNKLGKGLVASIRQSLDSHSPARRLIPVGQDVGAGIVVGMDSTAADVAAAAVRMADAAVPSGPVGPSMAAPSGAGAKQGVLDGLTVRVFIGSEELSHIARSEVYKATGELVAVIDAGGGG
ncbi:phage tail tape measure protein [Streptomyces sp. NPDC059396]|uniref:phage tail tape measure protein n=1 Tax=Streptomyces sp. NPDC059396 TaxID=3346819 RepID=UPI0036CDD3AD